jgi:purine catabolism regulator
MSITVQDILKLPIMEKYARVLTRTGLSKTVEYVTVMEAPSIHFSNFGEGIFVLTTLSAYRDSLEKINSVIAGLCKVNVAAIGIKLGRFVDEIDPSTLEIAARYSVPLIVFPSNVLFREILNDTLALITGNQRQTLNLINVCNRAMIDAIAQNCTISDLLKLLCKNIKCYCACFNLSGQKLAEAASSEKIPLQQSMKEEVRLFLQRYPDNCLPCHRTENAFLFPCASQDQLKAIFYFAPLNLAPELIFPLGQSMVSGINIKILEQDLKLQTERSVVSAMLDDILFSRNSDAKTVTERLQSLNFSTHKFNRIIVISTPVTDDVHINWIRIEDTIQNAFLSIFKSSLVFKRGNECVALISYESEIDNSRLHDYLSSIVAMLMPITKKQFNIGCSIPTTDIAAMSNCYQQAKKAIQFGAITHPDLHIYMYSDYFELGLISCGITSSDAQIFLEKIISPLTEYDKRFRADLWNTLVCCFMHNKLEDASAALHIHISTLRYRLQKIAEITGYSYFDTHNRMSLYIALLLYKLAYQHKDAH